MIPPEVADRFWSKAGATAEGCWSWTGTMSDRGYAVFWFEGRSRRANRLVHVWLKGPIPPGYEVDHTCRTRACVNPDHLEAITHKDNVHRKPNFRDVACIVERSAIKRSAIAQCPQGHPYSAENTYRHNGRRHCRECMRARHRAWYRKKIAA